MDPTVLSHGLSWPLRSVSAALTERSRNKTDTNLGEVSVRREDEAGKVHFGEFRVVVHAHTRGGGGSAAVQVVLPGEKGEMGERSFSLFHSHLLQHRFTAYGGHAAPSVPGLWSVE